MKVDDSTSAYIQARVSTPRVSKSASATESAVTTTSVTSAPQTDQVSISGQALMLSRLFGTTDPNDAPPVETGTTLSTVGDDVFDFLTEDDRNTLSTMYAYAQQQGASLKYVDSIAADLGEYRKFGSVMANSNAVGIYDEAGHALSFSFTDQDASTAQNILGGDAINSTQLDPGFLEYELDPGYSFNHTANFDFLEQMVNHFSGAGTAEQQPLDPKFSTYVPNGLNNFVTHTSSEVVFHAAPPDIICGYGHWTITEQGVQDGFTMQNGVPVQTKSSGQVVESESSGQVVESDQDKVNTTVADAALGLLSAKKPALPPPFFDWSILRGKGNA